MLSPAPTSHLAPYQTPVEHVKTQINLNKITFDLGLSGAPATTAVQSLWYGGFKIGFKAGLNSPGLVCAGQGCPA